MESREKLREDHRTSRWIARTALVALIMVLFGSLAVRSQTLPSGFSRVNVATVYYPTAMAHAPDGRIFVCEKSGRVRIIKNGVIQSTGSPFLQVSVSQENERGLDGIVLDPNFSTNGYVYVYYTTATSPVHNRLSRFHAVGDYASGGETVLLDFEAVQNSIHNGGGMVFGPDGKLYLAIGDDHVSANAQDFTNHKGKVLRLNADGTTPGDNPFASSTNPVTRRIYAYGFRNPYTLAVQPGIGKIFANDVGEGSWEEINNVLAGHNYGWPYAEGNSSNSAYTNPVYTYSHFASGSDGGCAVTGGTFFNPTTTNYPSQYIGKYFFIDYCNSWINYLTLNTPATKTNFASNIGGSPVVVTTGKDGNLYYFSISGSTIYKIVYNGSSAPVITQQPVSKTVTQGQPVTFTVSASGTAPLAFQWQKNSVNIPGATSASYTIASVQSTDAGQYRAVVTNAYGSATSNAATLTVGAYNAAPVATISSPVNNSLYTAGDVINVAGDATDAEDGTLPASAFNWYVEFHHNSHIHPGPNLADGVKTGSFTIPVTGEVSANVFYRVVLVVTDANGLKDTAYADVKPRTSLVSLATQPAGLQLTFDGQPHVTPYSTTAVEGMQIPIGVVSPQTLNGTTYVFDHWVHGGAASQTITVPTSDVTYTAVFTASGSASTTLVAAGSSWRYLDNGSNQGTAWRSPSFIDTGWKTGNAQLGYGDGDEATVVSYGPNSSQKYTTTYFRKSFNVVDKSAFSGLKLELLRDDGAVVYINGQEVYRSNMPGGTVYYNTFASTAISGTGETTWLVANLGTAALVNGTNYIAVEIHQSDLSSSDISFNLKLTGVPASSSTNTTFIAKQSGWKYLDNGSNQGTTWTAVGFNDTGWKTGNAQLGYGDGDEATVVSYGSNSSMKYVTTYFRKAFSVSNASAYTALALQLLKDDGAVVYLNGHEIYRVNMPSGSVYYNTFASAYVDGAAESTYNTATLSSQYLVTGTNVLAVEIHQSSYTSSDISFDLELKGTGSAARLSATEETDGIIGDEPAEELDVFMNVFPNPSNGEFNITYTLAKEASTMLEVYDALGKRVYVLDKATRHGADTYKFSFSPAQLGLNSEVYFIKLTVDDKSYMTKLLYMK